MARPDVTRGAWRRARAFLPEDLDELAKQTGAIRRTRRVGSGEQLLRAFLVHAECGSLRSAAALAGASGLVEITPEGLFYRLSRAEKFLEAVLWHLVESVRTPMGYRLVVVDATTVCGPGATGTDWRVHVGYDPERGLPCSVHVGPASVGESFKLHAIEPGALLLADRAYGNARCVHHALGAGADVLVRVQHAQVRLLGPGGRRVKWDQIAQRVPPTGAVDFELDLPVPPDGAGSGAAWHERDAVALHPVRLVGARTLKGDIVWLMTNLTRAGLPSDEATELYRARWQIELHFKRLKSLGDLEALGSRDGPTAKPALLAKMILLTLASLLADAERAFPPYGYPVRKAQPLA